MELVTYFQGLLGRIEPSAGHVAKAKAAHEQLRERLRNDDEVSKAHKDTYLSGSYARHTAIRDIKDVDVICLLDLNTKVTEPIVLLRWLESRLLEYYDKVVVQGRSIGITSQQGVDLDTGEFPPLFSQGGERLLRSADELEPEFLIRHEPANHSFNGSLRHRRFCLIEGDSTYSEEWQAGGQQG